MFHTFNVSPEIIKSIKEGKKKNALKGYYVPVEGKQIGLINSDTDKIDLGREDKDVIMDEENIEESLRPYFACNYMYTIDSFENIQ
jgi:hypothetical protein